MESPLQQFFLSMFTEHAVWQTAFLYTAFLFPLALGLVLLLTDRISETGARILAAIGFTLPALIAIWIWSLYNISLYRVVDGEVLHNGGFVFLSELDTGLKSFGIQLKLGLNGISTPLYLLAGLVGASAGFYALQAKMENPRLYWALLLIMLSGLMGMFSTTDIFFFYFFHELALIPTFLMMGLYGGKSARSIALEMAIYLTFGAMLSLLGLIILYTESGAHTFDIPTLSAHLAIQPLSETVQRYIFPFLLLGFGTLVSLFPFHSWAPRGYAAAPASTAMLHAGVLKKFGLYGLIQIAAPLLPMGVDSWMELFSLLALGNVLFIGFVTMAQDDFKQMIGFGSVMHMGYIFLAITTMSAIGIGGAVTLMVAHGFSVALLFLLSDVLQKRTQNLDMGELGGLAKHAPVMTGYFIAAAMASAGLPGFAPFWGELSIFLALFGHQPWLAAAVLTGIIISAVYLLRAVSKIFFGEPTPSMNEQLTRTSFPDMQELERTPAVLLLFALLIIGVFPKLVTESIDASVIRYFNDQPIMFASEMAPQDSVAHHPKLP